MPHHPKSLHTKRVEAQRTGSSPPFLQVPACPVTHGLRGSDPQMPAALEGTTEQTLCLMPPLASLVSGPISMMMTNALYPICLIDQQV